MNDLRSTRAALQPGDLIGSTFLTTDAAGQAEQRAVYIAFGEYVAPNGAIGGDLPAGFPRYGYAGAHGYEEGHLALSGVTPNLPPITLLHVGERWYDPALGRFLQRDPIGLPGGLNAYLYCEANGVASNDPWGLANDWSSGFLPPGWEPGSLYGAPRPPHRQTPTPPRPPRPPTLGDQTRNLKRFRTVVKGLAGVCVLIPGPIGTGATIGLIGMEVYEQWTEEDDSAPGYDTPVIE